MISGAQKVEDDKEIKTEDKTVETQQVDNNTEQKTSSDELETLRAELERTRAEKRAAESRADSAERERTETHKQLVTEKDGRFNAEDVAITNAIAAAVSKAERLEKEIVEAQENGKFADAAKLTRQLASAQNEIDKWEDRKGQYETAKKQAIESPRQVDPYAGMTPATKDWVKRHPLFESDKVYRSKALAAHYEAEAKGIPVDSQEYFDHIEDAVEGNPLDNDTRQTTSQRNTRTATPPSRGTNGSTMNKNTDNRLSAEEVEMAIIANPKLSSADAQKKYFDEKERLIREGKISRRAS